jgi:hypothetical protein
LEERRILIQKRLEVKRRSLSELLAQRVSIANLIMRNASTQKASEMNSMNFTPLRLRPQNYMKDAGFGLITPPGRMFDSPSLLGSMISVSPCASVSRTNEIDCSGPNASELLKLPFILMVCPLKERMDCQIDDDLTHVDFACT